MAGERIGLLAPHPARGHGAMEKDVRRAFLGSEPLHVHRPALAPSAKTSSCREWPARPIRMRQREHSPRLEGICLNSERREERCEHVDGVNLDTK